MQVDFSTALMLRSATRALTSRRYCAVRVGGPLAAAFSSTPVTPPQTSPSPSAPVSTQEKLRTLLKNNGKQAMYIHLGLSAISLTSFTTAFYAGVDTTALLDWLYIDASSFPPSVGTFALAYACHKASIVVRAPISVAVISAYVAKNEAAGSKGDKGSDSTEADAKK
jgi:hypothetical protein